MARYGMLIAVLATVTLMNSQLSMASDPQATPELTITEKSGSEPLVARIGTRVTVKLSGMRWSGIEVSGEDAAMPVLRRVPNGQTGDHPGEAAFVAEHPGEARLSATGRPNCQPGQACPHFARAWSVTLQVVR